MLADLQAAADVGAHGQFRPAARQVGGLDAAQFRGHLGLHQVVDAGAAAADPRLHGLKQLHMGDLAQEVPGLVVDALAVEHVAGIVIHELEGPFGTGGLAVAMAQGLEGGLKGFGKAHFGQELLDVGHGGVEGVLGARPLAAKDLGIELEGVAATGGAHQHRIEGLGPSGLARSHHGGKAGHQLLCQGLGLLEFALVVGHGAAAALVGRDHHLDAVGAEHRHGGLVHGRIKQALHAAQHQPDPVAPGALGGHHQREAIGKGLRGQGRQQAFDRLQLGAHQAQQATAAHQALQGRAGVEPQGSEQGPQAAGVGQQGKQQLAQGLLAGTAQFRRIELGAGGLDQQVVAHA